MVYLLVVISRCNYYFDLRWLQILALILVQKPPAIGEIWSSDPNKASFTYARAQTEIATVIRLIINFHG